MPEMRPGCEEAKINVDWVISGDAGARQSFNHALRQGLTPFLAVRSAQRHNRHAQETLDRCQDWVIAYLTELGFDQR